MAESSPPKDLDIFGKELGLTSAERSVLVGAGEIFLRKILQVDTFSKKGDPTEPKTLVITNSRCYVLSHRPAVKLEISFNFLKIQLLECTESKLTFQLPGEKPREFHSTRRDSVEIIGLITAQLKNVFPITQLEMVLKLTFDPDSLRSEVTSLRDSLLSAMDRSDASSLQGFITSYAFLSDFFGVSFNSEVVWYLKNVYLAHGFRDLNLSDFNHLSTRDLLPVLSTLRHNEFFEGFTVRNDRLSAELVEELCYVINVTRAIKKIVLHNVSLRPENLVRMSVALKNNPRSALVHLDLSDNSFDDKSIESLGNALENLPHGLQHLVLANCKISNRGGSMLAQSLKQNKHMEYSLVHFDLSSNPLGPDPLGALTFIQEPQTISHLNLSGCGLTLDSVVQVLIRGCQQHLTTLNLSHNSGKGKKGVLSTGVAAKLQQFCSSCIAISNIDLTDCRLTNEIVSAILEGLSVNPNVTSVNLNVSSNDLGCGHDPGVMAKVISRTQCLHKLDISDCGLDQCLPIIVECIAVNSKLRHVALGRNFSGKQTVRVAAMDKLCSLLKKDDCHLSSLSVQDSKLKDLTFVLLTAVSDNTSLLKLNISGNQMGNHGARYLAKVLLTNYHLREVGWDHNDTSLCGLQDVISALKHNYTLRVMPLPLADIGRAGKEAERIVQEIQLLLCRNHSDERLKVELAARHRGRLLTATQQSSVVSRELVQLEDLLQWAESVHGTSDDNVKEATQVKSEANNVLKLTDGLYNPQVESDQLQAISTQVKSLLDSFMDQVYTEHIKATSDRMVEQTLRACPSLLTDEAKTMIRGMVLSSSVSSDFTYAKKLVTKKSAPEVVSHVSAINLDVAANITELIVEQTLVKLDKANLKLMKMHKDARASSATPDTKVSRNFTFRVEQNTPITKKKRARRPDPDDVNEEEQVDLPSEPLVSVGPALQHLGKTRPKPARMQRGGKSRPSVKPSPDLDTQKTVQEGEPVEEEQQPPPLSKSPLLPPSAFTRTPSPQDRPERTISEAPLRNNEKEHSPPPTEANAPAEDEHLEGSTEENPVTPKASPRPSPLPRPPKTDPSKENDKSGEAEPEKLCTTSPNESPSTPELLSPSTSDPDTTCSPDSKPNEDDKPVDKETPSEPDKTENAPADSPLPQEQTVPAGEETTESQEQELHPSTDNNTSAPTLHEKLDSPRIGEKSATPPVEETPTISFPKEEPEITGTDKQPSTPLFEKPSTLPVTESSSKPQSLSVSEDDHKQVDQLPPSEPKIILPVSPIASKPPDSAGESSREEVVTPPKMERTPSPNQTEVHRRGSAESKKTKERKRHGLSKIFGKKSKPEEKPTPAQEPDKTVLTTSRQSGDWEVLESKPNSESLTVKEKPPATKGKPAVKPKQRPQPTEPEITPTVSSEPAPIKRLPGGVQMPNVNMNELANALGKKKPKLPPPTAEKPTGGSPKPERRTTMDPPAPKPRPKPRTIRKPAEDQSGIEPATSEPITDTLDSLV